ncbi:hypothetical protein PENTCL1PPCAC_20596, partial [Pristionchus entomophagus]
MLTRLPANSLLRRAYEERDATGSCVRTQMPSCSCAVCTSVSWSAPDRSDCMDDTTSTRRPALSALSECQWSNRFHIVQLLPVLLCPDLLVPRASPDCPGYPAHQEETDNLVLQESR